VNEHEFFQKLARAPSNFTTASGGIGRRYDYGKTATVFQPGSAVVAGSELPMKTGKVQKKLTSEETYYCYVGRPT